MKTLQAKIIPHSLRVLHWFNIYYNNSSTPEFHYQNFSANTDGYQQVSLSVTPEKTNEVVNYIAFAFVYGYNENEMLDIVSDNNLNGKIRIW